MSDKFKVTIKCPRCKTEMTVHKARVRNWIHRCKNCKEHFMIAYIEVDE